ncbi:MAG: hypothetical protein K0U24_01575 [Gammaproteobacteria bacterium]|nr:hypothetical protein [Gammaproteobacteria bacterium]MCH9762918.1 hypothetical protein [Gammaproteobacteria bacterium]
MPVSQWRAIFYQSKEARVLERSLSPVLIESTDNLKTTAHTDVKHRRITLNVSQSPIKCALSYAYELKNLEHANEYSKLITLAKEKEISKGAFVKGIIHLEAEAIYFRCKVFNEIGVGSDSPILNQAYSDIYALSGEKTKDEVIKQIASYIKDNGVVRREYPAKKYYADSYDFHSGSKAWPKHYDEKRSESVVIAHDSEEEQTLSQSSRLRVLSDANEYSRLIALAKETKISKAEFVKGILRLEAEAIYFKCKVFNETETDGKPLPCRQAYLDIYSLSGTATKEEVINKMASYMKDSGVVRREYSAKKYYADSYDFHSGSKAWPEHYNEKRSESVVIAHDIKKTLERFKSEDDTDEKESKNKNI